MWWLPGIHTIPPDQAEVPPTWSPFSNNRTVAPCPWATSAAASPAAPVPSTAMSTVSDSVIVPPPWLVTGRSLGWRRPGAGLGQDGAHGVAAAPHVVGGGLAPHPVVAHLDRPGDRGP